MRAQRRTGFNLFQLLVLLVIIAILLALMIPAVARVRMAADRAASMNNIKQMLLGSHSFHNTWGFLPLGTDKLGFSAPAHILPYIEQQAVYNMIDFKSSVDAKANADARKTRISTFISPTDPIRSVKDEWGATNYLFNDKVFVFRNDQADPKGVFITLEAGLPDGTSNTAGIGETLKGDSGTKGTDVKRQHVLLKKNALKGLKPDAGVKDFKDGKNVVGDRCASWMDGRFLQGTFNGELKLNDERPDVSCAGAGGVSALRSLNDTVLVGMVDGTVRPVNAKKITHETWRNVVNPADGNVLPANWSGF